jgi:hypothetical protein
MAQAVHPYMIKAGGNYPSKSRVNLDRILSVYIFQMNLFLQKRTSMNICETVFFHK